MIKSFINKLLLAIGLTASASSVLAVPAVPPNICKPQLLSFLAIDVNNAFPITIGGAKLGPYSNPFLMKMPPVCKCPGSPLPGIGVTFWQPDTLVETTRGGCFSAIGGVQIPVFSVLGSEYTRDSTNSTANVASLQAHTYKFDVLSSIKFLTSLPCAQLPVDVAGIGSITEIDPRWNVPLWANIFAPESGFFANPVAVAACMADVAIVAFGQCYDALFWCAGTHGSTYPLDRNSNVDNSPRALNELRVHKLLATEHRQFTRLQAIGPGATCGPIPNPIMTKCQYRYNQVAPIPRYGKPQYVGSLGIGLSPLISHTPTNEFSQTYIWQGVQCCLDLSLVPIGTIAELIDNADRLFGDNVALTGTNQDE